MTSSEAIARELSRRICVKRTHGLGNVICLLPVLDRLAEQFGQVEVVTQPEWADTFEVLRPGVWWSNHPRTDAIDLDILTARLDPCEHRTDELGRLIGLEPPFSAPKIKIPEEWSSRYKHLAGMIMFAPEGGHPSRQWPKRQGRQFCEELQEKLVLVGTTSEPELPCKVDTRGTLNLQELMGVLANAAAVVSMDSAVLHIAAALGRPVVGIFGGIDPSYRIKPEQRAVLLRMEKECCPCNKNEVCDEEYPCIGVAEAEDVIEAVKLAQTTTRRVIKNLHPVASGSLAI